MEPSIQLLASRLRGPSDYLSVVHASQVNEGEV
jgi:hypothetical protein